MSQTTLYGIKNCDTVKKAIKWLEQHQIAFNFVDFKKGELTPALYDEFAKQISPELLINKRSTTFRALPDEVKANLTAETIKQAVLNQPTLLKRPLLKHNNQLTQGFKADLYQSIFSND